jgi:hypothetical protein
LGSPRWCRRACFHARARPIRLDRPPGVSTWLHSSCLHCLFRAPSRSPLPCPFGHGVLPGSPPSSRHHRGASTSREGSQGPAPFRPQAITASRRFTPRSGSEVCFTLEPCSGMSLPFRGFSLRVAWRSRRASLPPCRWRPVARTDLSIRRPRPEASASRLPSTRRRVRTGSVLSLTGGRSPLRVPSPPGSLRSGWGRDSSLPTARDVVEHRPSLAR